MSKLSIEEMSRLVAQRKEQRAKIKQLMMAKEASTQDDKPSNKAKLSKLSIRANRGK